MNNHNQCPRKVISQQCLMKDLTTGVAIMPMFVSNNSKLLESTNTFDRRSSDYEKATLFGGNKTLHLSFI